MKKSHIIIILVIAAAVMAMITTMGDASTYETFASANLYPGKEFHVVGTLVKEKEMQYNPEIDPNSFIFYLEDKENEVKKVIFKGAKPQDFERSEQIVLTGKVLGEEFIASKILMKCPSKYNDTEVKASL